MLDVDAIRAQFPALAGPRLFLDGPAGSQVPRRVIAAMGAYLERHNANTHGRFATSRESDALIARARAAAADLLGAGDADEIAFGPNMTTLTFALARALGRTWRAGDELVVSRLDHDANVAPWLRAAADSGAAVKWLEVRAADGTLDPGSFEVIGPRTRLVAVGAASNAVGTINPVAAIAARCRAAGAQLFVDAVHLAPHALMDVATWDCDYLACSAYKFFGPHVGILWGRRALLAALPVDKVRPSDDSMPSRWETGTQSHEGIAGTLEAIEYLADLSGSPPTSPRRVRLARAFEEVVAHERALCTRLLTGLRDLPGVRVLGIADPARAADRAPTVSLVHDRLSPHALAESLAARDIQAWHGNFYALELSTALGLEPHGMLRLGLLHYNTTGEVDRLLSALREICA
ncbi:MAG TPA: cysteine desulfurase-like protein [Kofleriaceae bacterium]|jgi:cysteine desulfurase family protein (TIGR01976 family)|nr:cysteine desulfurase-like protein [Kofleriaceae bacterium]